MAESEAGCAKTNRRAAGGGGSAGGRAGAAAGDGGRKRQDVGTARGRLLEISTATRDAEARRSVSRPQGSRARCCGASGAPTWQRAASAKVAHADSAPW